MSYRSKQNSEHAKDGGWIKLYRKLLFNGWIKNHKLFIFWIYCLLEASHRVHKVILGSQQVTLQPGQFVFGREKAAQDTGLSPQSIRTCVHNLATLGNITIESTNKYSVITVVNWERYQGSVYESTSKATNYQPATNQQSTTYKNRKNLRQKIYPPESEPYRLSLLLFNNILSNNPNSRLHNQQNKKREETLQGWADDIRKLIDLDKQSPKTIMRVVEFATENHFWQSIILSGENLRKKWDQLTSQLLSSNHRSLKNEQQIDSDLQPSVLDKIKQAQKEMEAHAK